MENGKLAGEFEQNPYSAGTVVGPEHGLHAVVVVLLLITPGSGVPMGTKKDALLGFGRVRTYYIIYLLGFAGVVGQLSLLHPNSSAELGQFVPQVTGTLLMSRRTGHARAESHLLLNVTIGRIGGEVGSLNRLI